MNKLSLPPTEHPAQRELIVFLLILAVTFAVYWQSLANGFLINWDDPNYVVNNMDAHGFSLEHVKNAFSRFYVGNYAPLHIVSYMLDYSLWGLKPAGYILHNIILHGLNGYLLYVLVNRISAAFYPSILSALLFLVHPIQVESVVWISQRKNLLAMLFFLLSMHLYISYRDNAAGRKAVLYTFSLVFFACSLLSKSVAVVLPVGLLLYDVCIERRDIRDALYDKLPFVAIAFAAAVVALLSQSGGGRTAFHGGTPYATFLTMLPVFVTYLRLLIVPTGLSGVYAPEIKITLDLHVAAAGILLLFILVAAGLIFRRERRLFFWLGLGVIGIIPVSQIVPLVTMMNDRYLYFPIAGIAPFLVLGTLKVVSVNKESLSTIATGFLILILILFGFMAGLRATVWKDSQSLWSNALLQNPKNNVAKYNLANVYSERGELDKLRPLLQELLTDDPDNAKNLELLGHYYYNTGELDSAESSYKRALELWPRLPNAYLPLGNIYLGRNDLKNAEVVFQQAEEFGSMTANLSYSYACLESLKGELPKAINYLNNAFILGFKECRAVRINKELDALRGSKEFRTIMTTYCSDGGR